jgi:YD repeat-containing protein
MVVSQRGAARRELTFKYNAGGRPTEIKLTGKGQIQVDYGADGEITDISSSQGSNMALQVTEIFQDLLSIVSVAGAKF